MKVFEGIKSLFENFLSYISIMKQPNAELSAVLSKNLADWDNRHQIKQVFKVDGVGNYRAVTEQGAHFSCKPKSSTFIRTVDMIGFHKGQAFIWLYNKAENENAHNILAGSKHLLNEINEQLDKESRRAKEDKKSKEAMAIEAQKSWERVRKEAATIGNSKSLCGTAHERDVNVARNISSL